MPRPPRDLAPGIHHIGSGASGPDLYYRDEIDHASWLRLFVKTVERYGWTVIIVVQLTTHWHAIVQTFDHSLGEGMQFLNGEYSRTFNERHIRVGYLVRDRYWSRRKSTETELITAYCYDANNPVFAGLVRRAEEWRWSSFASTVGLSEGYGFVDASPVVAHFGSTPTDARESLRRHVAAIAGAMSYQA
jgi:REP-associated tyrosine transposase